MISPKLFISYSWSSPEHEKKVIDLATELRESYVDVILDKWDLKEGHDAIFFMEKMVNDPEIKKVLIICDAKYAAKADDRAGGVGTETQIISRKVYENQAQEKFVAVVCEKDEKGKPYLPTYYNSRIYIDLSEIDGYTENFERLLRWIFDKPLYIRPELGKLPSFLSEGEHVSLGTTAMFKRCVDAIKNHKPQASGALDEYCTAFSENLERFRIGKKSQDNNFDDKIINNIEEFLPFRNEAIQLFIAIAQYATEEPFIQRLHRFFESLIPYMTKPESISQYTEFDFDNYKFIVHELFLFTIAILLKHERLEQANVLLQQEYYIPGNSEYGKNVMINFTVFMKYMKSLEYRNDRLKLNRSYLRADLLKERCASTGIDFRYLLQADFVAFMRAEVETKSWWPETFLYIAHSNSPFEIFARANSKAYFNKAKVLLTIETPKDLDQLIKSYQNGSRNLPHWRSYELDPSTLLGYQNLAVRP